MTVLLKMQNSSAQPPSCCCHNVSIVTHIRYLLTARLRCVVIDFACRPPFKQNHRRILHQKMFNLIIPNFNPSTAYTHIFSPKLDTHPPKPPRKEPQEVMATVTAGEYEEPQEDTPLLFRFIFQNGLLYCTQFTCTRQ